MNVAQFMANIEVDCTRTILQGINNIRKKHDKMTTEKASGQGIEKVSAEKIGLRYLLDSDLFTASLHSLVKIGILLGTDSDAGPLQM